MRAVAAARRPCRRGAATPRAARSTSSTAGRSAPSGRSAPLASSACRACSSARTRTPRFAFAAVEEVCRDLGIPVDPSSPHYPVPGAARARGARVRARRPAAVSRRSSWRSTFRAEGFPEARLLRHRYGYDPAQLQRRRGGAGRDRSPSGFFGRGEPRKGLHLALRAWLDSGGGRRRPLRDRRRRSSPTTASSSRRSSRTRACEQPRPRRRSRGAHARVRRPGAPVVRGGQRARDLRGAGLRLRARDLRPHRRARAPTASTRSCTARGTWRRSPRHLRALARGPRRCSPACGPPAWSARGELTWARRRPRAGGRLRRRARAAERAVARPAAHDGRRSRACTNARNVTWMNAKASKVSMPTANEMIAAASAAASQAVGPRCGLARRA